MKSIRFNRLPSRSTPCIRLQCRLTSSISCRRKWRSLCEVESARGLPPEPLTEPYVILSHHTALVIEPSDNTKRVEQPRLQCRILSQRDCRDTADPMTWPLRSTAITAASSLLRTTPPLRLASVLAASWLHPLGFLPSHRSNRFPRSVPEPVIPSRRLYTGCRSARHQATAELVPGLCRSHGFDIIYMLSMPHQRFTFVRLGTTHLTGRSRLFRQRSLPRLLTAAA
jgi:hypothetical protein